MKTLLIALAMAAQAVSPPPVTIAKAAISAIDEPRQVVARSAAEWAALWKQHSPGGDLPAVDLSTRTVVAVFLGSRPSAGFAAEIVGTQQKGSTLVIQWREQRPDPGAMTAQMMSSPAHIVSIPRFAGEITFEKVTK